MILGARRQQTTASGGGGGGGGRGGGPAAAQTTPPLVLSQRPLSQLRNAANAAAAAAAGGGEGSPNALVRTAASTPTLDGDESFSTLVLMGGGAASPLLGQAGGGGEGLGAKAPHSPPQLLPPGARRTELSASYSSPIGAVAFVGSAAAASAPHDGGSNANANASPAANDHSAFSNISGSGGRPPAIVVDPAPPPAAEPCAGGNPLSPSIRSGEDEDEEAASRKAIGVAALGSSAVSSASANGSSSAAVPAISNGSLLTPALADGAVSASTNPFSDHGPPSTPSAEGDGEGENDGAVGADSFFSASALTPAAVGDEPHLPLSPLTPDGAVGGDASDERQQRSGANRPQQHSVVNAPPAVAVNAAAVAQPTTVAGARPPPSVAAAIAAIAAGTGGAAHGRRAGGGAAATDQSSRTPLPRAAAGGSNSTAAPYPSDGASASLMTSGEQGTFGGAATATATNTTGSSSGGRPPLFGGGSQGKQQQTYYHSAGESTAVPPPAVAAPSSNNSSRSGSATRKVPTPQQQQQRSHYPSNQRYFRGSPSEVAMEAATNSVTPPTTAGGAVTAMVDGGGGGSAQLLSAGGGESGGGSSVPLGAQRTSAAIAALARRHHYSGNGKGGSYSDEANNNSGVTNQNGGGGSSGPHHNRSGNASASEVMTNSNTNSSSVDGGSGEKLKRKGGHRGNAADRQSDGTTTQNGHHHNSGKKKSRWERTSDSVRSAIASASHFMHRHVSMAAIYEDEGPSFQSRMFSIDRATLDSLRGSSSAGRTSARSPRSGPSSSAAGRGKDKGRGSIRVREADAEVKKEHRMSGAADGDVEMGTPSHHFEEGTSPPPTVEAAGAGTLLRVDPATSPEASESDASSSAAPSELSGLVRTERTRIYRGDRLGGSTPNDGKKGPKGVKGANSSYLNRSVGGSYAPNACHDSSLGEGNGRELSEIIVDEDGSGNEGIGGANAASPATGTAILVSAATNPEELPRPVVSLSPEEKGTARQQQTSTAPFAGTDRARSSSSSSSSSSSGGGNGDDRKEGGEDEEAEKEKEEKEAEEEERHRPVTHEELKQFFLEITAREMAPRRRIHNMLYNKSIIAIDSLIGRIYNWIHILVVLFAVTQSIVLSMPEWYVNTIEVHSINFIFETWTSLFFTLDFIARVLTLPHIRKILSFSLLIDFLSFVSYYIEVIYYFATPADVTTHDGIVALRVLRILRIFRIFKIMREHKGVKLLYEVIKVSFSSIVLMAVFILVSIMIFSSVLFSLELFESNFNEAENLWYNKDGAVSCFQSIPETFLFICTTMCTVGYGDCVPLSWYGKGWTVLVMFSGVMVLSFPNILIGANFSFVHKRIAEREARERLGRYFRKVRMVVRFIRMWRDFRINGYITMLNAPVEGATNSAAVGGAVVGASGVVATGPLRGANAFRARRMNNFIFRLADYPDRFLGDTTERALSGAIDTIHLEGLSLLHIMQRLLECFSGCATVRELTTLYYFIPMGLDRRQVGVGAGYNARGGGVHALGGGFTAGGLAGAGTGAAVRRAGSTASSSAMMGGALGGGGVLASADGGPVVPDTIIPSRPRRATTMALAGITSPNSNGPPSDFAANLLAVDEERAVRRRNSQLARRGAAAASAAATDGNGPTPNQNQQADESPPPQSTTASVSASASAVPAPAVVGFDLPLDDARRRSSIASGGRQQGGTGGTTARSLATRPPGTVSHDTVFEVVLRGAASQLLSLFILDRDSEEALVCLTKRGVDVLANFEENTMLPCLRCYEEARDFWAATTRHIAYDFLPTMDGYANWRTVQNRTRRRDGTVFCYDLASVSYEKALLKNGEAVFGSLAALKQRRALRQQQQQQRQLTSENGGLTSASSSNQLLRLSPNGGGGGGGGGGCVRSSISAGAAAAATGAAPINTTCQCRFCNARWGLAAPVRPTADYCFAPDEELLELEVTYAQQSLAIVRLEKELGIYQSHRGGGGR